MSGREATLIARRGGGCELPLATLAIPIAWTEGKPEN